MSQSIVYAVYVVTGGFLLTHFHSLVNCVVMIFELTEPTCGTSSRPPANVYNACVYHAYHAYHSIKAYTYNFCRKLTQKDLLR